MSALPFKLNQDRRHHIPEQKRKVTNWRDYDESLRRRGSLTVWFSDEAVKAWEAERRTSRGGQPEYSDLAILTALTFKAVFRLAYRQTEGLIGSVIGLLGLDLAVPDHTTLCRRAETLEVPRPKPRGGGRRRRGRALAPAGGQHGAAALRRGRVAGGEARHQEAPVLAEAPSRRGRPDRPDRGRHPDRPRRRRRRPSRPLAGPSRGPGRLRHGGRRVRPRERLRQRGRAPPGRGRRRSAALECRAQRHGRDRADAAGLPPATHRREGQDGLAEGLGLQCARPGGGHHRPVQARDRGRAALAYGRASGD